VALESVDISSFLSFWFIGLLFSWRCLLYLAYDK